MAVADTRHRVPDYAGVATDSDHDALADESADCATSLSASAAAMQHSSAAGTSLAEFERRLGRQESVIYKVYSAELLLRSGICKA